MVHKITYKDRNNVINCYLPEGSVPDKNAEAELYRMTALEETLERLAAVLVEARNRKSQKLRERELCRFVGALHL